MGRLSAGLPLFGLMLLLNLMGQCEMSIYPGLRRKPQQSMSSIEVASDYLAQLMEENARRRLQQQFEQQLEVINHHMQMQRQRQRQELRERFRQKQLQELAAAAAVEREHEREDENQEEFAENTNNNNIYDDDIGNVAYNFKKYPTMPIPFAVGPSDPRFYETEKDVEEEGALDDYEEYATLETLNNNKLNADKSNVVKMEKASENAKSEAGNTVLSPAPVGGATTADVKDTNFHRIKPQPAAAGIGKQGVNNELASNAINSLIDKLQKQHKPGGIAAAVTPQDQVVVRQHLGMERDVDMYLFALIAGVSAAVTVGLIAIGIAWYTLHNKTKAAADVEYPAYGITGPNKDISPSGDRKLAQSAQIYHYQHQKQQIIAMENRQNADGNCGLSDVDSDDDNEEGDYTVYECPGLAPTGEMEVKNPLFLDDTPATPANNQAASNTNNNNITQATPQQPATIKKGKVLTNVPQVPQAPTSSEETKKKKTKK